MIQWAQDGPTMPIVAEGDEEPNDTFREQLIASAEAAVKVGKAPSPPATANFVCMVIMQ